MDIAIFGSSLVSSYWNGAATYYRGMARALYERGHCVTFYEPDAYERQQHRDIDDPHYAKSVVYAANEEAAGKALALAASSDVVAKTSGVGVLDEWLEREVLELQSKSTLALFWDVDAPATLDRCESDESDAFRSLVPRYDAVLTYGGGHPVVDAYQRLGAKQCIPIYNALDPSTHHPTPKNPRFDGVLGFLGNRLPDREARVYAFFVQAALRLPKETFILGGSGWVTSELPENIRYVGHVGTADHNAFNCTPKAVLNINRDSMARYGFSPPTRVFEAAGAGACLFTDAWVGLEEFLEPNDEVIAVRSGEEVVERLAQLTAEQASQVGARARERMLVEHTYAHRAVDFERALEWKSALQVSVPAGAQVSVPAGASAVGTGSGSRATRDRAPTVQNGSREPLKVVVLGLSITSSWGNGHATTYRALVREFTKRGHEVHFLERDVPWYAAHRDMAQPSFCRTSLYQSVEQLREQHQEEVRRADVVIVGSYVPDGKDVARWAINQADGAVVFYDIDTPATLAHLRAGTCEYLEPALIPQFDSYLSFSGGPILKEIETAFGAKRARALHCSVDDEAYYPTPSPQKDYDLGYLGTYSDDRQPTVEKLCLQVASRWSAGHFVVAGPQYPQHVVFPDNVQRIEHLPPDRHVEFYNAQRFTLNVTREDMIAAGFSPSVRLFEAAAAGTPIISDYWDGLDTFFERDREVVVAESADDVLRVLRDWTEEKRLRMASLARQRVLARHTAKDRARELELHIMEVLRPHNPQNALEGAAQ